MGQIPQSFSFVTLFDLLFTDAAKLGAGEVECPSSSAFSLCVALEYRKVFVFAHRKKSFPKFTKAPRVLVFVCNKRQQTALLAAIVYTFLFTVEKAALQ